MRLSKLHFLLLYSASLPVYSATEPIFDNVKTRPWTESSVPIIVIGGIIASIALCAAHIMPVPATLSGDPLSLAKNRGIYSFICLSSYCMMLTYQQALSEYHQDAIDYIKAHKEEIIAKLEKCPEQPKKQTHYKTQAMFALVPLITTIIAAFLYFRFKAIYDSGGRPDYSINFSKFYGLE